MKDLLKDTMDFEFSFELKIAICSMLVIYKDRSQKQTDAMMRFEALLKSIQDYIFQIDAKYGSDK